MVLCRLFGSRVLTHIAPHCTHLSSGPPDLEIVPRAAGELDTSRLGLPSLSVPMRHPEGEGPYQVWRQRAAVVMKVSPVAEFQCMPDRITYQPLGTVPVEALQWQLFGLILSGWSEWVGRPVLHAATVEVAGEAVGFLAQSGVGKSSLTMEFLQSGHRIFGDDQLVLDETAGVVRARPSVPWLKLSESVAARSGLDLASLPKIHSASAKRRRDLAPTEWVEEPAPVGALYLLERGGHVSDVVVEPVGPSESLLALVQHSYVPRTVAAAGLAGQRLPLLAAAVQQGGVWRLRYPDGIEWLPRVREAVVRHRGERLSGSPARSPR